MTKMVTIGALFTDDEINAAIKIWKTDRGHFHTRVRDEIITPAMSRIAETTGQENNADYLAYAIEYVMQSPFA